MALANNSISLFSPYEPGECAKRIAALIDHDESIASVSKEFDGTHDLIGKADAGVVCLRRRLPSSYSFYGGLFKPLFNGVMKPQVPQVTGTGAGTVVEGAFAVNGISRVVVNILAWGTGGFLLLMWVLLVIKIMLGNAQPGAAWGLLVIPLVMGAGYLYGRWMWRFAQADVAFISQFLRETLNAGHPPNAV